MKTFAATKKRSSPGSLQRHVPAVPPSVSDWHNRRAAVRQILRRPGLQAKLTIGAPGDVYEQEAERVADEVMRMPEPRLQTAAPCNAAACPQVEDETIQPKTLSDQTNPLVQRQVEEEEEEELIQTKTHGGTDALALQRQPEEEEEELLQSKELIGHTPRVTPSVDAAIASIRGGGQPLRKSERAFFEPRFQHSFSQVRVHSGAQASAAARAVNAQAFTVGRDIVFGAKSYAPGTASGRRLLAHELTHVVQQARQTGPSVTIRCMRYGTGSPPPDWVSQYNARVAPADDRDRVDKAIGMMDAVVNDQDAYPRCHDFFHQRCPDGTANSLLQIFNKAVLWKADRRSALAFADVNGDDIAFTQSGYNSGARSLAVTLIHELMHNCGITGDDHYLADVAGLYCIGHVNVLSLAGGPIFGADVPYFLLSYRRFLADLANGQTQLTVGADINAFSSGLLVDRQLSGEFGSLMAGLHMRGLEEVETGERIDRGGERFGGVTARLELGASLGRFRVTERRGAGTGLASELGAGFVVQAGLGAEFYIPIGVEALPLSLGATYRMVQPLNTEAQRMHGLLFELGMVF